MRSVSVEDALRVLRRESMWLVWYILLQHRHSALGRRVEGSEQDLISRLGWFFFFYFSLKAILPTVSGTRDSINTAHRKTMLSFTSTDPDIMPIFLIWGHLFNLLNILCNYEQVIALSLYTRVMTKTYSRITKRVKIKFKAISIMLTTSIQWMSAIPHRD